MSSEVILKSDKSRNWPKSRRKNVARSNFNCKSVEVSEIEKVNGCKNHRWIRRIKKNIAGEVGHFLAHSAKSKKFGKLFKKITWNMQVWKKLLKVAILNNWNLFHCHPKLYSNLHQTLKEIIWPLLWRNLKYDKVFKKSCQKWQAFKKKIAKSCDIEMLKTIP